MLVPPADEAPPGVVARACGWVARRRPAVPAEVDELRPSTRAQVLAWYRSSVEPVLTPTAIDGLHPLPRLRRGSRHLLVLLRVDGEHGHVRALVTLPRDRHVEVRSGLVRRRVQAHTLVAPQVGRLFRGRRISRVVPFRVVSVEDAPETAWGRREDRPRQRVVIVAEADDETTLRAALHDLVDLDAVEHAAPA